MSVAKSFPDNKRSVRGHDFEWTDKHLTAEQLMPFRQQADDLALAVVEKLLAIVAAQQQEKQTGAGEKRPDLYTVLKDNYAHDSVLREFWEETHSVPDWVDWEEIEKGQAFLYRYLAPNITGIVLQGCLGENAVCSIPDLLFCKCTINYQYTNSHSQQQEPQRSLSELEASTYLFYPRDSLKPSSGRSRPRSLWSHFNPVAKATSPPFACGSCMQWSAIES